MQIELGNFVQADEHNNPHDDKAKALRQLL